MSFILLAKCTGLIFLSLKSHRIDRKHVDLTWRDRWRKALICSWICFLGKNVHTHLSPFPFICFRSYRLSYVSIDKKSWNSCQHVRRGRHYLALYPCRVCTLAWPSIVVRGKKVALWCAKWFTDLEDINKLFIQDSEQEVPSNFKQRLWKNNSLRLIPLLSLIFSHSMSSVVQMAAQFEQILFFPLLSGMFASLSLSRHTWSFHIRAFLHFGTQT